MLGKLKSIYLKFVLCTKTEDITMISPIQSIKTLQLELSKLQWPVTGFQSVLNTSRRTVGKAEISAKCLATALLYVADKLSPESFIFHQCLYLRHFGLCMGVEEVKSCPLTNWVKTELRFQWMSRNWLTAHPNNICQVVMSWAGCRKTGDKCFSRHRSTK